MCVGLAERGAPPPDRAAGTAATAAAVAANAVATTAVAAAAVAGTPVTPASTDRMAPSAYMGEHDPVGAHEVAAAIRRPQVRDFVRAFGGVADEPEAAQHNTAALNHSLRSLSRGDTLHIPAQVDELPLPLPLPPPLPLLLALPLTPSARRRSTSLAASRATGWST